MTTTLQRDGPSARSTSNGLRPTRATAAHRRNLAALSPGDRAGALLDRYPDLHLLPGCDWERLGVPTVFSLLFGAPSRHFANVQLAALAGLPASAGRLRP